MNTLIKLCESQSHFIKKICGTEITLINACKNISMEYQNFEENFQDDNYFTDNYLMKRTFNLLKSKSYSKKEYDKFTILKKYAGRRMFD